MPPVLFPIEADGGQVIEVPAYLTDLITAYNGTEQRVQLRGLPVMGLEYAYFADTPREAQLVESLIHGNGAGDYIVPLWHLSRRLTAPASLGASSLSAGRAGLPRFPQAASYYFVLWSNASLCEAVPASTFNDTTATLSEVTQYAWATGTLLVPAVVCHLTGKPGRERVGPSGRTGTVAFEAGLLSGGYAVGATTKAIYSAAGYLGLDVLTGEPCGLGSADEDYGRRITVVGGDPGLRVLDAQEAAPGWTRSILVKCFGHDEVEALRVFLDARRGRAVPFWMPSLDYDLTVNIFTAPSADVLVEYAGYTDLVYPAGPSRRHVQVLAPSGTLYRRKVVGVDYDGVGAERLTLSSSISSALPAGTPISFLRYCRLDTDVPRIVWSGTEYAECSLPVIEVPAECPA
jgi:hypothetical protein